MMGLLYIGSRGYGCKIGPLIACCLFIWMFWLTAFPSHAHDMASELESYTDAVTMGSKVGKLQKEEHRFVPVPVPISSPTSGSGLVVGLLYMWPQEEDDADTPTSISGVAGLYTNTDSWAAAIFHQGFYAGDRFRVQGGLGYADFNLKYYGIGSDSFFRDNPLDYNITGRLFSPRAEFQLPFISKDSYLGLKFNYLDSKVGLDLSGITPVLPEVAIPERVVGLGPVFSYDSRNNVHSPSQGSWLDVSLLDYGDYLGGDFDYLQGTLKWTQYFPVTDTVVLGYRFDGQFTDGGAPFYALPYINLRGFSRGVYADDQAVTLQGQVGWDVSSRWTVSFFGGGGRVAKDVGDLGSSQTQFAGGAGFRYMIDPKSGISIGADLAGGGDGIEFYVQVGDFFAN